MVRLIICSAFLCVTLGLFIYGQFAQGQSPDAASTQEATAPKPDAKTLFQLTITQLELKAENYRQQYGSDNYSAKRLQAAIDALQSNTQLARKAKGPFVEENLELPATLNLAMKIQSVGRVMTALSKKADSLNKYKEGSPEIEKADLEIEKALDQLIELPLESKESQKQQLELDNAKAEYDKSEHECQTSAAMLRKAMKTRDTKLIGELTDRLHQAVVKAFSLKTAFQSLQLDQAESQIRASRKLIECRQENSTEIIQRRYVDLLSDDPTHSGFNMPARIDYSVEGKYSRLRDAVQRINWKWSQRNFGGARLEITENEVVAAVRWAIHVDHIKTPDDIGFRAIAERRILPSNWSLTTLEDEAQVGRERTEIVDWKVRLFCNGPGGEMFEVPIHDHFLFSRMMAVDGEKSKEVFESLPDYRPLADAIKDFNRHNRTLAGLDMAPLTIDEVVTAIRYYHDRRADLNISNEDFDRLMYMGESKQLPPNATFELTTKAQPNSDYEFSIWSVHLKFKKLAESDPESEFNIKIRNQFVRSDRVMNDSVTWGPINADMIQVGVRLNASAGTYRYGQPLEAALYFRNVGNEPISGSFPRLLSHDYYNELIITDSNDRRIMTVANKLSGKPIEWETIELQPDGVHKVYMKPFKLGGDMSGFADVLIDVERDNTYKLKLLAPNYLSQIREPLESGVIEFSVK